MSRVRTSLAGLVTLAVVVATVRGQGQASQNPAERVAASVNGEKIMEYEIRALLAMRPSAVVLTNDHKKEMQDQAINMLIDDALMRQFLRKYAPPAMAQEIQKELADLTEDLKKKNTTLQEYVKQSGQTMEQLQADIAGAIQWRTYLGKQIPDATAREYYAANKPHFDKILVRASHILVQLKAGATTQEKQTALQKIEAIRQEIVAGRLDFADAARKYSDCSASKPQGGDIGHFRYKFVVVEAVARATFGAKVGDITPVVTTDFGYHILKITDRSPGEPSTYEAMKDVIREVYAQDHEWYQRIIANERKNAKIEVFLQ
jgi:parvulin-like peptidyl-prolyl isomerase